MYNKTIENGKLKMENEITRSEITESVNLKSYIALARAQATVLFFLQKTPSPNPRTLPPARLR